VGILEPEISPRVTLIIFEDLREKTGVFGRNGDERMEWRRERGERKILKGIKFEKNEKDAFLAKIMKCGKLGFLDK